MIRKIDRYIWCNESCNGTFVFPITMRFPNAIILEILLAEGKSINYNLELKFDKEFSNYKYYVNYIRDFINSNNIPLLMLAFIAIVFILEIINMEDDTEIDLNTGATELSECKGG